MLLKQKNLLSLFCSYIVKLFVYRPPVRQEDVAAPPPIESRPVDPLLQNDYKRPKSTNIYGDDWDK